MTASGKLSLILAALITLSSLSACAADTEKEDKSSGITQNAAEAADESGSEKSVIELITDGVDFKGREFIIGWSNNKGDNECAVTAEETAGDIINEGVYERNRLTEEKIGVSISARHMCAKEEILATLEMLENAGDCPYDALICSACYMFESSMNGYLYDLRQIGDLDLSAPWWDVGMTEMYSLGSKSLYMFSGDINYADDLSLSAFAFNKRICDDIGMEYPYQTVRDGAWTLDRLIAMGTSYGSDVNGDGKYGTEDTYGFFDNAGIIVRAFSSSGENIVIVDDGGSVSLNASDKIASLWDKLRTGLTAKNVVTTVIADRKIDNSTMNSMFYNGQGLMTGCFLLYNMLDMRNTMEDDFGILPPPKYDETQERYHSPFNTVWGTVCSIPATSENAGDATKIMNVMGYYSQDSLTDAVIDRTVKTKASRDEESAEMVELLFDSKFFEIGQWGVDIYSALVQLVASDRDNIISVMEKYESKTQEHFTNLSGHYDF